MRSNWKVAALGALSLALSAAAWAQPAATAPAPAKPKEEMEALRLQYETSAKPEQKHALRELMRKKWEQMSPKEREELRASRMEQMRQRLGAMEPEDQSAAIKRHEEWRNASPEQRARMRELMRQRRDALIKDPNALPPEPARK